MRMPKPCDRWLKNIGDVTVRHSEDGIGFKFSHKRGPREYLRMVRTCYFGTCCSVKMPKFVGDDRPTRKSRVANLKGGLLLQQ